MSEGPLVLITRTDAAGKKLTEKVLGMGLEAVHCAPFALKAPEQPDEVASNLKAHLPADRVIITSQEGVRRSVELVGAERFSRSLVIVPGEGSARLARELGMANVVCPSRHGTSEAMLVLPELLDIEGLDILILAAEGGRGLMGRVLMKRGANVDRIHVYRRIEKEFPPGLEERISAAGTVITLAASWEAVTGLCERVTKAALGHLKQGVLVGPSRRVAEKAAALGFVRTTIAAGADDDAMLAELERIRSPQTP